MPAPRWNGLPPVERVLGDPPGLLDPEATRRSLTTQSPPVYVGAWVSAPQIGEPLPTSLEAVTPPTVRAGEPRADAPLARRVLLPPPAPPAPEPPAPAGLAATPRQLLGDHVDSVPEPVRREVEAATGAGLKDVAVVRSAEAARAAAAAGAMAFTSGATVHMPRSLGPLEVEPAREVLAHELVHVSQQRAGSDLPAEKTRGGRALEAEAQRIARPPRPPALPAHVARADHSGALVFAPPASPGPPAPMQRRSLDEAPAAADAPEPVDLDELAHRLYPRIRPYLKKDISLDRERSARNLRGLR